MAIVEHPDWKRRDDANEQWRSVPDLRGLSANRRGIDPTEMITPTTTSESFINHMPGGMKSQLAKSSIIYGDRERSAQEK